MINVEVQVCRSMFLLDTIDWDFGRPNDVCNARLTWQNICLQIMEECVPRVVLCARHNLPCLHKRIIQAMKRRKRLYKICKCMNNNSISQQYVFLSSYIKTFPETG